jgi:hypothetical protein
MRTDDYKTDDVTEFINPNPIMIDTHVILPLLVGEGPRPRILIPKKKSKKIRAHGGLVY